MATFAAVIGNKVIFPKAIRSVAGGTFITNDVDSLFTSRGFVTPYWPGAGVITDYLNGNVVPRQNACSGELGFLITHEQKVYTVDLWRKRDISDNANPLSLIEVFWGDESQYIVGSPTNICGSVRMAFHLCNNDLDKAMRLLGRRNNIIPNDYICMTIQEIAERLKKEDKTEELLTLDPMRFTAAD